MPHMPATGVSGLDLYVKEKGRWQFVGRAPAKDYPTNEAFLAKGLRPIYREFMLYPPLYNGVSSVESRSAGRRAICPALVRPQKPIVFDRAFSFCKAAAPRALVVSEIGHYWTPSGLAHHQSGFLRQRQIRAQGGAIAGRL